MVLITVSESFLRSTKRDWKEIDYEDVEEADGFLSFHK